MVYDIPALWSNDEHWSVLQEAEKGKEDCAKEELDDFAWSIKGAFVKEDSSIHEEGEHQVPTAPWEISRP